MRSQGPRGGVGGERMDNVVEPNSENKLVRVSGGTSALAFLGEIRVLGWFVN